MLKSDDHFAWQMPSIFQKNIHVLIKNELKDMETSSTICHLKLMFINMPQIPNSEKSYVNSQITITFKTKQ